jgi:serine/threonine protein kinase
MSRQDNALSIPNSLGAALQSLAENQTESALQVSELNHRLDPETLQLVCGPDTYECRPRNKDALLGKGGFGDVFRTVRVVSNNEGVKVAIAPLLYYALKHIKNKLLNGIELSFEEVAQEAKILQRLDHQFIVKYVASLHNETNLTYFIIMEYVDGLTLSEKIVCKYVPIEWMQQIADALDYLHSCKHIIHRDLKPANVLVSVIGNVVKLCDFGLACEASAGAEGTTNRRVGTRNYFSYEKIVGLSYENGCDDMWAVGCILVQLLTGKRLECPLQQPEHWRYSDPEWPVERVNLYREQLLQLAADVSPFLGGEVLPGLLCLCPERGGGADGGALITRMTAAELLQSLTDNREDNCDWVRKADNELVNVAFSQGMDQVNEQLSGLSELVYVVNLLEDREPEQEQEQEQKSDASDVSDVADDSSEESDNEGGDSGAGEGGRRGHGRGGGGRGGGGGGRRGHGRGGGGGGGDVEGRGGGAGSGGAGGGGGKVGGKRARETQSRPNATKKRSSVLRGIEESLGRFHALSVHFEKGAANSVSDSSSASIVKLRIMKDMVIAVISAILPVLVHMGNPEYDVFSVFDAFAASLTAMGPLVSQASRLVFKYFCDTTESIQESFDAMKEQVKEFLDLLEAHLTAFQHAKENTTTDAIADPIELSAVNKILFRYRVALSQKRQDVKYYVPPDVVDRVPESMSVAEYVGKLEAQNMVVNQPTQPLSATVEEYLQSSNAVLLLLEDTDNEVLLCSWFSSQALLPEYARQMTSLNPDSSNVSMGTESALWLPIVIELKHYCLSDIGGLLVRYLRDTCGLTEEEVRAMQTSTKPQHRILQ